MKVIAKTKYGFIVEMEHEEIAALSGGGSSYSNLEVTTSNEKKEDKKAKDLSIGDEVNVDSMYRKSKDLLDSWEENKKAVSNVKSACTRFENAIKEAK